MYDVSDTIVAVGSPTSDQRVIIRISGPETTKITSCLTRNTQYPTRNTIQDANLIIDDELQIESQLYLFFSPHSYTGEDVAEIHLHTNPSVTAAAIDKLLKAGCRAAEPGEFTARAYLNGKIDLAQAEAVNEIIVSSNTLQLAAAEKLLHGRLSQTTARIRAEIMETMSLIEAGLDFSPDIVGEDIEFITRQKAIERLDNIKKQLEELLATNINYESIIDLPSVGIAGAPGAGKSSLLNRLTGTERSIVSDRHKTTRDVLTSLMQLAHCRCVLFDCAGLIVSRAPSPRIEGEMPSTLLLDELSQQAAIEALRNSNLVLFCVDISSCPVLSAECCVTPNTQYAIRDTQYLIRSTQNAERGTNIIPVATKCDLLTEKELDNRLAELKELFVADFIPTSSKTGAGIDTLLKIIDDRLIEKYVAHGTILTARHKKAVTEAITNIGESIDEPAAGNDEVTAMLLRAAYQALSTIESVEYGRNIDEKILELIFNRFCIGK